MTFTSAGQSTRHSLVQQVENRLIKTDNNKNKGIAKANWIKSGVTGAGECPNDVLYRWLQAKKNYLAISTAFAYEYCYYKQPHKSTCLHACVIDHFRDKQWTLNNDILIDICCKKNNLQTCNVKIDQFNLDQDTLLSVLYQYSRLQYVNPCSLLWAPENKTTMCLPCLEY